MVNEEIVGGIKNALERGNSLRDAMISFFNAGYETGNIDENSPNQNYSLDNCILD